MLMKKLQSNGDLLHHMEFNAQDKDELFKPLDEVTDDLFDDAVECAKEVYFSYLNDDKSHFKLFAYLDRLSSIDRGFTYNISTDSEGNMTGFCWMTSTMRSHFERYHNCIFLDTMRRKTNVHLWPYISIVIVNDMGEAQPVIEGFVTSELDEAYMFVINSALEMAPNVDPTNIGVVFGDQFFTKELIIASGLTHAKLFYDHYHLGPNQEKELGSFLYGQVKDFSSFYVRTFVDPNLNPLTLT